MAAPVKNPAVAVRRNLERAEAGDKLAQSRLGRRYLDGDGVERNELEAKRWLRAAEVQGDRPAAQLLAELRMRAPSQPSRSFEEELQRGLQLLFAKEYGLAAGAFRHAHKLAPPDEPSAAYNLGCCYALQGRVEDAVGALRDAVANGMTHQEILEDPDRMAIFGDDDRYTEVWNHAEHIWRLAGLERRAQKVCPLSSRLHTDWQCSLAVAGKCTSDGAVC
jgi:tetratricopeptide (TPR) repeat protein